MAQWDKVNYVQALAEESASFSISLKQLKDMGISLGNKPLIVITAGSVISEEDKNNPVEWQLKWNKPGRHFNKN